jgi:hypothetical protein
LTGNIYFCSHMKTKYFIVLIILFSVSLSCGILKQQVLKMVGVDEQKRERLMKTGKSAKAEVLRVEDTNVTINKNPEVRLYLKVKPDDADEFDAEVETVVSRVNIPRKGDIVKVWYDPKNRVEIVVE